MDGGVPLERTVRQWAVALRAHLAAQSPWCVLYWGKLRRLSRTHACGTRPMVLQVERRQPWKSLLPRFSFSADAWIEEVTATRFLDGNGDPANAWRLWEQLDMADIVHCLTGEYRSEMDRCFETVLRYPCVFFPVADVLVAYGTWCGRSTRWERKLPYKLETTLEKFHVVADAFFSVTGR